MEAERNNKSMGRPLSFMVRAERNQEYEGVPNFPLTSFGLFPHFFPHMWNVQAQTYVSHLIYLLSRKVLIHCSPFLYTATCITVARYCNVKT